MAVHNNILPTASSATTESSSSSQQQQQQPFNDSAIASNNNKHLSSLLSLLDQSMPRGWASTTYLSSTAPSSNVTSTTTSRRPSSLGGANDDVTTDHLTTTEPLALPGTPPPATKTKVTPSSSSSTTTTAAVMMMMMMSSGGQPCTTSTATPTQPPPMNAEADWQKIRKDAIAFVLQMETYESPSSGDANNTQTATAATTSSAVSPAPDNEVLDKETLRGLTQRPSGAWQAQIYYAGKTRYIGVFDSQRIAGRVYQVLRERLQKRKQDEKKRPQQQQQEEEESSLPPLKKRRIQQQESAVVTNQADSPSADGNGAAAATMMSSATNSASASSSIHDKTSAAQPSDNTYHKMTAPTPGAFPNARLEHPFLRQYHQPIYPNPTSGIPPPQHRFLPGMMPFHAPPPPPHLWTAATGFASSFGTFHPQGIANPPFYPDAASGAGRMMYPAPTNNQRDIDIAAANNDSNNRGNVIIRKSTPKNKTAPKKKPTPLPVDPEQEKEWKSVRNEVLDLLQRRKSVENSTTTPSKHPEIAQDVLRGLTVRPSGKFQAQLYFAGQSRYIGVFDTKHDAALAYEMIRDRLKPKYKYNKSSKTTVTTSTATASTTTRGIVTPSPTTIGGKNGRNSSSGSVVTVPSFPTTKLDG
jgi:hypothetical protein